MDCPIICHIHLQTSWISTVILASHNLLQRHPSLGSAVISFWPNPKKFYKWYKSAEVHTKQSFKLPLWLFIPLIGIAIDIYFVPRAYAVLSHGISGKGIRIDDPDLNFFFGYGDFIRKVQLRHCKHPWF